MKKNVKKLWLQALRSGKYLQAKGRLRTHNKFCCLGVLCDLHGKKFKQNNWTWREQEYAYLADGFILSSQVKKWAGLNDSDPEIIRNNKLTTLASLNDGNKMGLKPKTFKQIANIIEKYL